MEPLLRTVILRELPRRDGRMQIAKVSIPMPRSFSDETIENGALFVAFKNWFEHPYQLEDDKGNVLVPWHTTRKQA